MANTKQATRKAGEWRVSVSKGRYMSTFMMRDRGEELFVRAIRESKDGKTSRAIGVIRKTAAGWEAYLPRCEDSSDVFQTRKAAATFLLEWAIASVL